MSLCSGPLAIFVCERYTNCVPNASIKLFADDTNVFVNGKTLERTLSHASDSLVSLNHWFSANNLSLTIDNTSYSVFGKRIDKA